MTQERLTAYLLQELTPEEAERFEDQCFAHEEWPPHLDSAEQKLIDAYLCNGLTKDQRLRFEQNYLTTDARKARVLTARSLLQVLTQVPTRPSVVQTIRNFAQRPLVLQVGLGIIVLTLALWLLSPSLSFLSVLLPINESHALMYLNLTSWDRFGGVKNETITVPLDRDVLVIYLHTPPKSPDVTSYRIEWVDANNSILGNETAPASHALRIRIPAAKLRPGQYVLKLYEISRDGTEKRVSGAYYFSAVEKS